MNSKAQVKRENRDSNGKLVEIYYRIKVTKSGSGGHIIIPKELLDRYVEVSWKK